MSEAFFQRLLRHYALDEEGFRALAQEPSFSSIPKLDAANPSLAKAKGRLLKAKETGEKVLIYGDYDVDGISSASIMTMVLRKMGLSPAYYLPSRYRDGYGISLENAKKIAAKGYSLVVTVDNGVSAHEPIAYLAAHGADTIIIDHHEIPEQGAPKEAILIHPDVLHYGEYAISAGFLSFLFSRYLLGEDDPYFESLAGLSTLSDMMPLMGYNRAAVRLALSFLNEKRFLPFFYYLQKEKIDYSDLSFSFIPALNALGRMRENPAEIRCAVSYFADPWSEKSERFAGWLHAVNDEKKRAVGEAASKLTIDSSAAAIVSVGDLPEGLNGLFANRLLTQYEKPVAVFSPKNGEPGVLVGSLRAKEGFSIIDVEREMGDILLQSGGHELAGGASIKEEELPAFWNFFLRYAEAHPFLPEKEDVIPLEESEVTLENSEILSQFAPFGEGWKEPKFLLRLPASRLLFSQRGYLSLRLSNGGTVFSFSLTQSSFSLPQNGSVSLKGRLSVNEFHGVRSARFLADEAEKGVLPLEEEGR